MSSAWHFPLFIIASLFSFIGVLRLATQKRPAPPSKHLVAGLAGIVVVGGMLLAKLGIASGWPVWLYYGIPAALTWTVLPIALRMHTGEAGRFIILAILVAPVIHVIFSFVLGWKEYLPFLPIPSFRELFS